MLTVNKFHYFLNESKSDLNTIKKCLLFTDIKGSSILWKDNESEMFDAIVKHEQQVFGLCDKHNGFVLKTIGDAFMISFDDLIDGIKFVIELQSELKEKSIKVGKEKLEIRVGMCYGDVYEREIKWQDKKMLDYFGNVVNTASRLESKVSEIGGFAFAYQSNISKDEKENIINLLEKEVKTYKVIDYTENSKENELRTRSGRLLSDAHKFVIRSLKKLRGVDDVIVYKCEL